MTSTPNTAKRLRRTGVPPSKAPSSSNTISMNQKSNPLPISKTNHPNTRWLSVTIVKMPRSNSKKTMSITLSLNPTSSKSNRNWNKAPTLNSNSINPWSKSNPSSSNLPPSSILSPHRTTLVHSMWKIHKKCNSFCELKAYCRTRLS
jgi:hypothetical protein